MNRTLLFAYGLLCYGLFLAVFVYLVAFVADLGVVPKTVSSGTPGPAGFAFAIDLGLLALFGVQHSMMARAGFKGWITRLLPAAAERSTYLLATNIVLILLFAYWQPLPGQVWQVEVPALAWLLYALFALGWVLILISTFLTDHFDLFGLRQVWLALRSKAYAPVGFREILFYRWIRHPMMLGFFVVLWATPRMTVSHLLFSLGMSIYILIGIHFEERGLQAELGESYRSYMRRTGRLLPFF